MIEHKHYKEVTRDVGEVRADVHQLKTQVRDISETIIPETQKEMDSMKKGILFYIFSPPTFELSYILQQYMHKQENTCQFRRAGA